MTNALSLHGLALIQEHEGFQPEPRPMVDDAWVVGYSHVRLGAAGPAVNQNEAAEMLSLDLAPFEKLVNARVTRPLTQSQFDALVSFAFSVGADAFEQSQVLRRVNAGDMLAAACAMDAWRKGDVEGELIIVDAFVRRRAAEKALFLRDVPARSAPSALMRAKLDHAAAILGALPAHQPKPEAAQRLTEILKSEPATEALLLTQVVPEDLPEDEIVTAHAKPVAARRQQRGFLNRLVGDRSAKVAQRIQRLPSHVSTESAGLLALSVFGLGLTTFGVALLMRDASDFVNLSAAAALIAPGLCAVLTGGAGFCRALRARLARV